MKKVFARYTEAILPEHRGNPLIEALPPFLEESEILLALSNFPSLDGHCSGQQKLATALESFQNNRSDSFGVKPPLY